MASPLYEQVHEPSDDECVLLHSCIVYTCMAFRLYGSACESSNLQQDRMICCIQHICVTSPRCEWTCESSDLQLDWVICCILSICVTSLQCESTYGWPVGWNIWMTWHTCCKDVSLLCPRSDLFSSYCLLTMTEESLSPLFIWSVRPLKKSTMYHLHHDSVVVRLFFTL